VATIFPGNKYGHLKETVRRTNFEVVFFHGCQFRDEANQMWRTTWSSRGDPTVCWPEEWLPPDLGHNVRVTLLFYDAYATNLHGLGNTGDVSEIAKNLVQSVVTRFYVQTSFFPYISERCNALEITWLHIIVIYIYTDS